MLRSALAFTLLAGAALAQEHGGKVDWIRDPEFGLVKAKLEGRMALLYFTADW